VIAVTGATGAIGGAVARHLYDAGAAQRLVVRNPGRASRLSGVPVAAASYGDTPALLDAFDGTDTLLDFTFLRDNLYLDAFPYMVGDDGVIRGPSGAGRVGAVARADVAEAAAAVLTSAGHSGATYDLTGPESLTVAEIAAAFTKAWGRPVRYEAETLDEAYRSREKYGAPAWKVAGWVTSYTAIAAGDLDVVTTAVQDLTGHRATSLADYLAQHPR